jgi:hypothetical protein
LLAFVAVQLGTFRVLGKIYRKARGNPRYQEIALATFCAMVSLLGGCVATFFLSMAYRFYFPALTGLAIAVAAAAEREFARDPGPAPVHRPSTVSQPFQTNPLTPFPVAVPRSAVY